MRSAWSVATHKIDTAEFHQGPNRELFNRYNSRWLDLPVAYAIMTGILDASQVPPELLEHLCPAMTYYEGQETG